MRYFDLEEANKVLESIKPVIYDFIDIREEMMDIIERISTVDDELEKMYMESVLEDKKRELNNLLYEISQSGAVVKGLNPLLLDFLSKKGNQDIWLCWLEGEDSITHWHGLDEGFMGRKPVELLEEERKDV